LLLICHQNQDLVSASVDILLVLAIQMQKNVVVSLVEILRVFNMDELKKLQQLMQ
jgi:hypothetical protein